MPNSQQVLSTYLVDTHICRKLLLLEAPKPSWVKEARVLGEVLIVDMISGETLSRKNLDGVMSFEDFASFIEGDKRANCSDKLHGYKSYVESFLHNDDMILTVANELKDQFRNYVTRNLTT